MLECLPSRHKILTLLPSYTSTHAKITNFRWVWWYVPVILALRRLKQKTLEFKATLGNMARCWSRRGKERKRKVGGRDGENGGKREKV